MGELSSKRIHQVLMFRSIHLYLGHIIPWAYYTLGILYLGHIISWAYYILDMPFASWAYQLFFLHTHDNFKPDIYNSLGHTNYFLAYPCDVGLSTNNPIGSWLM